MKSHPVIPPLASPPSCSYLTHLLGSCPLGQPKCSLILGSAIYPPLFVLIAIIVAWLDLESTERQVAGHSCEGLFSTGLFGVGRPTLNVGGTFWWQLRRKGDGKKEILFFLCLSSLMLASSSILWLPLLHSLVDIRTSFFGLPT